MARPLKYPWPKMEVGDVRFYRGRITSTKAIGAARAWGRRHGVVFSAKKHGSGLSIKRVA